MNNKKENPLGYKPIAGLLASLAIPAVISNIVNALYNIVDQIFIGQGVGYVANAATNIAFPITTICLAIGLMTGLGAASNFNLELGRKNYDKAKSIVGTAVSILIIAGIIITTFIILNLKNLLVLFGATEEILKYAIEYTSITSIGLPFLLLSIGLNPLVRADGSPIYSMIAVVSGAIINTILDPIFIFVFNMGIAGAAWATVISQVISATMLCIYLFRFKAVSLNLKDFIPKFISIKAIISIGISSFIFQSSTMIIQVVTNNLLKYYGSLSVYGSEIPIAVAGIVIKINVIFIALIIGIVQGSQPIISYNYGAKNYKRVRETLYLVLRVTFLISLLVFLIFEIFPSNIISIFGKADPMYFEFATKYMRVYLMLTILNGVQIAGTTFFQAIGKSIKGVILSLIKQVIVLLPLLLILPKVFNIDGIMYATPITDFIAIMTTIIFLVNELKIMPKE